MKAQFRIFHVTQNILYTFFFKLMYFNFYPYKSECYWPDVIPVILQKNLDETGSCKIFSQTGNFQGTFLKHIFQVSLALYKQLQKICTLFSIQ